MDADLSNNHLLSLCLPCWDFKLPRTLLLARLHILSCISALSHHRADQKQQAITVPPPGSYAVWKFPLPNKLVHYRCIQLH